MEFESTPDNGPNLSVADAMASATLTTPSSGRITGENTPTGRKTPVKPSLKSTSNSDQEDNIDNDNDTGNTNNRNKKKAAKKKKKNRTLKWDEAKIQEHDQLRGTRMKIDEPNTPFAHYDSGSETDGSLGSHKGNAHHKISWDALTNKLEAHAAVAGGVASATGVAAGVAGVGGVVYPPSSPSSHGGGNMSSDGGGNYTTDEEDEDQKRERQRAELKRLEFQEHRKRHYNEMEVVRRFRRECPDGEPTSNGHSSEDNDNNHDNDTDDDNDGDDENE